MLVKWKNVVTLQNQLETKICAKDNSLLALRYLKIMIIC